MKKVLFTLIAVISLFLLLASPATGKAGRMWSVPGDFATIQAAIDSSTVAPGDTILVKRGIHAGALVTKSVNIVGFGNAVIDNGPAHGSGLIMGFRLLAGSDGSVIKNLTFKVDLAIMNGAAVNDVTVEHNTFLNSVQAVSNWRGNKWTISHNDIIGLKTSNGGGIGVLIGDYSGGIVQGNIVTENKISGTLYVGGGCVAPSIEQGGYNGSGIVIYADFRWGALGASAIKNNQVTHNNVAMVSNNPDLVDIIAFEMTDTRDDSSQHVIFDNVVGFNDFRRTAQQIVLTPDNLDQYNSISRNLGENRGHGMHPWGHDMHPMGHDMHH